MKDMPSDGAPLVSVCVPVYETEPYLAQALRSAYTQDFDLFEIVVASDASRAKDASGRSAKKIVRAAQKESDKFRKEKGLCKIHFTFIEFSQNRGVVEVRRALCLEARGLYIVQLDSDDALVPGALRALYDAAADGDFDIVHGTSAAGSFDAGGNFIPAKQNRYGKIFYGQIFGRDIFRRWLLEAAFTGITWGKLIKADIWRGALSEIPYTECCMADDFLLFFFLSRRASSYKGIEAQVCRYRVGSGMSGGRKIDSLHRWKMICSAASVFSVVSVFIESRQAEFLPDEIKAVKAAARRCICNNIWQMNEAVVPELRGEARSLLCEYWGEGFVQSAEQAMAKQ